MVNGPDLSQGVGGNQMSNDAAANWRIVCLITLGAFLGLSVAAFATGLLPGDLVMRQELLEPMPGLAHQFARLVNQAGTWRVLLPATLLLFLLSRAARRHWWLWSAARARADFLSASRAAIARRRRRSPSCSSTS